MSHFHKKKILLALCAGSIILHLPLYGGILSLYDPFKIPKASKIIYINSQNFLANNAFSLKALFHNFHGKFYSKNSQNKAVGDIRLDIGFCFDKYGYFGYSYRKEAISKATNDTVKLIYQVSNQLKLDPGKKYNLYISLRGFETQSITYSDVISLYDKSNWNISSGYGIELMKGSNAQNGYASGNALAVGEKDYNFNIYSNYYYIHNYLYSYHVASEPSYGYTMHLAILLQHKHFSLKIIGNDIFGKLYWKDLPYSRVVLNTKNKTYDKNGYAKYAPMIYGYEGKKKYTQRLMSKWRFESKYKIFNNKYILGVDCIENITLPYISYIHKFNNDLEGKISYESFFKMFGVGFNYKSFHFFLSSNGFIDTSAVKISFGYVLKY